MVIVIEKDREPGISQTVQFGLPSDMHIRLETMEWIDFLRSTVLGHSGRTKVSLYLGVAR